MVHTSPSWQKSQSGANPPSHDLDEWVAGRLLYIRLCGMSSDLKDAKGLRYLARLLQHSGRRFHVSELVAVADARRAEPGGDGAAERARNAVTNRIRQSVARIGAVHGALGLHLGNAVHTGTVCSYTHARAAGAVVTEAARVASLRRM